MEHETIQILGLVWYTYFLVLGIACPEQADYANNLAELIVAVLTAISILFAFVEFLRRKGNGKPDLFLTFIGYALRDRPWT